MSAKYLAISLVTIATLTAIVSNAAEPVIERYTPAQPQVQAQVPPPVVTLPSPTMPSQTKSATFDNKTTPPTQYKKFNLNVPKKKKKSAVKKHVAATTPKSEETAKSDDTKTISTTKKSDPLPSMEEIRSYVEKMKLDMAEKTESKTLSTQIDESTQTVEKALKEQAKTIYAYYPGGIYTVWTREGLITDIWLQPNEEITSDILGADTVRWIVQQSKSGSPEGDITHVSIRPMFAGLQTNIIINTNKHSYNLKVISTKTTYNPIISWNYPIEQRNTILAVQKEQTKAKEEVITEEAISPEKINFGYSVKSNAGVFSNEYPWTPSKAFDDGTKTYIQVNKKMRSNETPALFIKERSGELNLVNYRLKGEYFVVDRLFEQAELRNGAEEIVTIKKTN